MPRRNDGRCGKVKVRQIFVEFELVLAWQATCSEHVFLGPVHHDWMSAASNLYVHNRVVEQGRKIPKLTAGQIGKLRGIHVVPPWEQTN